MRSTEIVLFACAYFAVLLFVIYFTRAPFRRTVAALAGGFAGGLFGMSAILLGRVCEWWQISIAYAPHFLALFYFALSISLAPIYLVTWRIVRRFGWRGLAVSIAVAALIGPPRDYLYATVFPHWMRFGPGIAPIVADGLTYAGFVFLGHVVMSFTAGAASPDRLR